MAENLSPEVTQTQAGHCINSDRTSTELRPEFAKL